MPRRLSAAASRSARSATSAKRTRRTRSPSQVTTSLRAWIVRPCKRRELQVRLADFGALGPPGDPGGAGAPGVAGTARAYAQVNSFGFILFGMVLAKNITGVTHPETGVYCVTPAAGIDPTLTPCVV